MLYLQAMTQYPIDPTMTGAAMVYIDAEYNLYNGIHISDILDAFDQHGLVQYVDNFPYSDYDSTGTTGIGVGNRADDWDVQGTDGNDNEYFLALESEVRLDITTRSVNTDFDTKIEVFERNGSSTGFYNDNGAGTDQAELLDIELGPGEYYIVIDGNGDKGRYELSITEAVPPEDIRVQYMTYNASDETNTIFVNTRIHNDGMNEVNLADVSTEYYYTFEGSDQSEEVNLDWAGTSSSGETITSDVQVDIEAVGTERVYTASFTSGAGVINPGEYVECHSRIYKSDWSNYNQANDFSFGEVYWYQDWESIAGFVNGILVWGNTP